MPQPARQVGIQARAFAAFDADQSLLAVAGQATRFGAVTHGEHHRATREQIGRFVVT